jgi:hypothetical protein
VAAAAVIDAKLRRFYAYWCLREAYVKMTGEALLADWLRRLEFRDVAAPAPAPAAVDNATLLPGEVVTAVDVYLDDSRVAGVAMELRAFGRDYMVATAAATATAWPLPALRRPTLHATLLHVISAPTPTGRLRPPPSVMNSSGSVVLGHLRVSQRRKGSGVTVTPNNPRESRESRGCAGWRLPHGAPDAPGASLPSASSPPFVPALCARPASPSSARGSSHRPSRRNRAFFLQPSAVDRGPSLHGGAVDDSPRRELLRGASHLHVDSRRSSGTDGGSLLSPAHGLHHQTVSSVRGQLGLTPEAPIVEGHEAHPSLAWPRLRVILREPFAEFFGTFVLVLLATAAWLRSCLAPRCALPAPPASETTRASTGAGAWA